MALLGTGALTLLDWAKRVDPNGRIPQIAELLSQTNEILADALFIEGNLPTGHRTTVRTGLPAVAWRLLNQGVTPSKSTTAQIDEQCGMLEAWSEVDVDLAMLNGNVGELRLSEAQAFLEAMNQEVASTLFYGNAGLAPEEFTGLSVRYSSLSAGNSQNVLDGAGSGSDNLSIWLIVWGANTVCKIFPKGSKAGLLHEDFGIETVETTAGVGGNRMRAYRERFQWKCGLALKDWRYAVRIANLDVSELQGGSPPDLVEFMIKAIHRIPNLGRGKAVFYMNRTAFQYLDIQRRADVISGGGLIYRDVDGKSIGHFRDIPVRICDALTNAEAAVV